jgi:hypothetical protein
MTLCGAGKVDDEGFDFHEESELSCDVGMA